MKILIAGGTGFIGQALAKHFIQQGHTLRIVGRDISVIKSIYGNTVTAIGWNQLAASDIADANVLINLAGANIATRLWTEKRKQELLRSRLETTQQLATLLHSSSNYPLFISASGIGIYPSDSTTYSETDNTNNPNFLGHLAQAWEQTALTAQPYARVVNMRLAVVIGKAGGMLQRLIPLYKLGFATKLGNGLQPFPWISLLDVLSAIDFIMANPKLAGPINFIAPEIISQAQFAETLAHILHRPCFLKIPNWFLKLIAGEMAEELLLSGQKATPKTLLDNGFNFTHPSLKACLKYEAI